MAEETNTTEEFDPIIKETQKVEAGFSSQLAEPLDPFTKRIIKRIARSSISAGDGIQIDLNGQDITITSDISIRYIQCVVFDFTADVETGDGKFYVHIPAELDGMNLVEVHAEVITAATGSGSETTDIQIHNVTDTVDMLSTLLTVDEDETGSDTASTAAVINSSNDDVAENDVIRIDVDAVPSTTPGSGLIVTLGFSLP